MVKVKKTKEGIKNYQIEVVKQMLQLATAGFGLVAALAWNELIKGLIDEYVKTKISVGSGLISLAIYAIIVTVLAVVVTLQLSRLLQKFEAEKKSRS